VEYSPFKKLLTTDRTFFRIESLFLANHAAGMGVPPSEIEDVVAETWLEAVKYGHQFADKDLKKRLHHWLLRVVHSKAVDALRRLHHHPCESLDAVEEGPIDDVEAKRREVAELRQWLDALLDNSRVCNEEIPRLLDAHFYQGRSIQELADESGTTAKSVDCRLRRGLYKLRELAKRVLHETGAAS
jgi:RNA polymerase sigma factor (sigma-70 family)